MRLYLQVNMGTSVSADSTPFRGASYFRAQLLPVILAIAEGKLNAVRAMAAGAGFEPQRSAMMPVSEGRSFATSPGALGHDPTAIFATPCAGACGRKGTQFRAIVARLLSDVAVRVQWYGAAEAAEKSKSLYCNSCSAIPRSYPHALLRRPDQPNAGSGHIPDLKRAARSPRALPAEDGTAANQLSRRFGLVAPTRSVGGGA